MSLDFISAFIIGLFGSGHCLSMCGGITTMLTSAIPNQHKQTPLIISYNLGRIFTYSFIGAIVGFSGSIAAKNLGMPLASLRLISGFFLVLLGLYIGGWLMWISQIEKLGKFIWRYLSPLSKKVLPVTSVKKSFILGLIWGWLPCGLVYSTLTWALASHSLIDGAAIMFFFGLGTLPALFTLSVGQLNVRMLLSNNTFKKTLAFLLVLYGFYTISFASFALF